MKIIITCILTSLFAPVIFSQNIIVQPYLQDADPWSMTIMWETDSGDGTLLQWGETDTLGNVSSGSSFANEGSSRIHTVTIGGLDPNHTYFYRVFTGGAMSEIFRFRTPSAPEAEAPFSLVAMSDMQKDGSNPLKFEEVVHDGVIDHIHDHHGPHIEDHLNMVVIPGDLVDYGPSHDQWVNDFFGQSHPLFSSVPVYPVPGNHEQNTEFFFRYFDFPDNGTSGFGEHWWYKDQGNLRLIGLDSNTGFRVAQQLDWLEMVLNLTCSDTTIDFVFAQLHHPHKSELWLPGELDYTGEVISLLEDFSSSCGKPSIHFFGHTHGYSRGQSKDHSHLWVNVATAGGNIDYWGEYAQNDYDEFTNSEDEYGFVWVDINAGDDPSFNLKRFSMGDEIVSEDRTLSDEITVHRHNPGPDRPSSLFPLEGDTVIPDCMILKASVYDHADDFLHGATQWQVANDCSSFGSPIIDNWRQHENWYNEIDLQAGDDLTDEAIQSLDPLQSYCYRVRYRDRGLAWSDWSEPLIFHTGESNFGDNLILNPGAEAGTTNWTVVTGFLESLTAGECAGIDPHSGGRYFAVGALCEESAYAEAYQNIDLGSYEGVIDEGNSQAWFGAWLADWNGSDEPAFAVQFFDSSDDMISSSDTFALTTSTWTLVDQSMSIPSGSRTARFILMGTRNAGADNDSYIDDIYFKVGMNPDSCSQYIPSTTGNNNPPTLVKYPPLIYPHPGGDVIYFDFRKTPLFKQGSLDLKIAFFNTLGEVMGVHPLTDPRFKLDCNTWPSGSYFYQVVGAKGIDGGVFIVE